MGNWSTPIGLRPSLFQVRSLIEEAKDDIELVISDLEDTIDKQRDEWRNSIDLFEKQYERGLLFPSSSTNSSSTANGTSQLSRTEISNRMLEIQSNIEEVGQDVEEALQLFKRRWVATTAKIETLPSELRELRTLSDLRRYVASTLFEGKVPALLTRRQSQVRLKHVQIPRYES